MSLPIILELNKCEWRASSIFQVNKDNLPIFVKQILNVFAPYVWGQVSHIDSTLTRHSEQIFFLKEKEMKVTLV